MHHLLEEPSKTTRSNGFGGGPRLIENNATDTPGPGSYTWDLKSYGPKWLGDIVALVCVEVALVFFADGMWSTTKGSTQQQKLRLPSPSILTRNLVASKDQYDA